MATCSLCPCCQRNQQQTNKEKEDARLEQRDHTFSLRSFIHHSQSSHSTPDDPRSWSEQRSFCPRLSSLSRVQLTTGRTAPQRKTFGCFCLPPPADLMGGNEAGEQHEQVSMTLSRLKQCVHCVFFFYSHVFNLINELNYSCVLRFLSPQHSLFLVFSHDASHGPHLMPRPPQQALQ